MTNQLIIESNEPLIDRIKQFAENLNAEIGIEELIVFGSTAKGQRSQNSDVDLIVISTAFENVPEPKRQGFLQHRWRYKEDIEAIALTPKEFGKTKKRPLVKKILEYAIIVKPTSPPKT